jgi:hypothetical protein
VERVVVVTVEAAVEAADSAVVGMEAVVKVEEVRVVALVGAVKEVVDLAGAARAAAEQAVVVREEEGRVVAATAAAGMVGAVSVGEARVVAGMVVVDLEVGVWVAAGKEAEEKVVEMLVVEERVGYLVASAGAGCRGSSYPRRVCPRPLECRCLSTTHRSAHRRSRSLRESRMRRRDWPASRSAYRGRKGRPRSCRQQSMRMCLSTYPPR